MKKVNFLLICFIISHVTFAQLIEVQADYTSLGDCVFSAHNNAKTPLFLNINFGDLENTTFNETLPYVKKLDPGFNDLFTLERDLDSEVPRFNYEIRSFKSNPMADVNLDFPYLIPFSPGSKVNVFDVASIDGFWGRKEIKSWMATGFKTKPSTSVYACRNGIIVEITGSGRNGEPQTWYNTWTNSITLLQPDGTLICYKNVVDKNKKLKLNQKIYAGQELGEIQPNSSELVLLIYQNTLSSKDYLFIIPQFITKPNKIEIVNSSLDYIVEHPIETRGLEMSKKEKRKILGLKK